MELALLGLPAAVVAFQGTESVHRLQLLPFFVALLLPTNRDRALIGCALLLAWPAAAALAGNKNALSAATLMMGNALGNEIVHMSQLKKLPQVVAALVAGWICAVVMGCESDTATMLCFSLCYAIVAVILRTGGKGRLSCVEVFTLSSTGAFLFSAALRIVGTDGASLATLADSRAVESLTLLSKGAALLLMLLSAVGLVSKNVFAALTVGVVGVVAAVLFEGRDVIASIIRKHFVKIGLTPVAVSAFWAIGNLKVPYSREVVRKLFHLLTIPLLCPLALYDMNDAVVLSLALIGLATALEVLRIGDVPVVAAFANKVLEPLVDHKDEQRGIVLTHIYMALGISMPITVEAFTSRDVLTAVQGLLVTAIGDTAAAAGGGASKALGFAHPMGATGKTVEGWLCFLCSYVISSHAVVRILRLPLTAGLEIAILGTGLMSATFETTTREIDNFVVPLFALGTFKTLHGANFLAR